MAADVEAKDFAVRVSEDGLEAYLRLYPTDEKQDYTVSDLEDMLEKAGIREGIDKEALRTIVENKSYYAEHLVAVGSPAQDGQDGEFEFLFNRMPDNKPKILPDGTVDYGNLKDLPVVEAGAELVRYRPAVAGINGVDVYGKPLTAKIGKELQVLKGKGFAMSDDKLLYTATVTGKVEYENERLMVSDMLTIDGDVTILTGNVQFSGDVFVKGSVFIGMTIQAKGSITVNGHVEGAQLIAGKDVILKSGMQGAGKGEIRAGGEVSGKFFEQATIYAKGSVRANAILNCHIMSEQEILVSGKKGVIVGGSVSAIQKIEATIIGNVSEVKTRINLGVDGETDQHIKKVKNKYNYIQDEISRIETGIAQLNKILGKADNPELAEKKLYLMRAKITKDATLASISQELRNLRVNVENSQGARLVVHKSIYRGTKITINGTVKLIESENYNVTYSEKMGEIVSIQNI